VLYRKTLTSPATENYAFGFDLPTHATWRFGNDFRGLIIYFPKENFMPTGTVKFFNVDKGYGFIQPDDGTPDSFVHITAVERAGMATLNKDQRLTYEVEADKRGKYSAVNLQPA
jgi:CspA family cold shock protein